MPMASSNSGMVSAPHSSATGRRPDLSLVGDGTAGKACGNDCNSCRGATSCRHSTAKPAESEAPGAKVKE